MTYSGNETTDIIYYTEDGKGTGKIRNCSLYNEFVFKHNTFIVTGKVLYYYVCLSKDGELLIAWSYPRKDNDNNERTVAEVMSAFRKFYSERGVTDEMLDVFIHDPIKFKKKYKKKNRSK